MRVFPALAELLGRRMPIEPIGRMYERDQDVINPGGEQVPDVQAGECSA